MKTRIFKAVAGMLLIAGALAASACHRPHSLADRAEWMTGKIAKHLELDDRQTAALHSVKAVALAARAEAREEHRALLEEVIAQVRSDRLDQEKLAQLLERHHALQGRLAARVLPKVAEWHAGLRPEQKAEAVEQIRRWMTHHDGGS